MDLRNLGKTFLCKSSQDLFSSDVFTPNYTKSILCLFSFVFYVLQSLEDPHQKKRIEYCVSGSPDDNINGLFGELFVYLSLCLPRFSLFFGQFIRGPSVTQRSIGRGAPGYPPQDPRPYKEQISWTRYIFDIDM